QRRDLLDAWLRDRIARALGTEPVRLDADKSLLNLGLDSLMAVELRNWVEGELHLNLAIAEVLRSRSLSHLADLLLAQLEPGASGNGQARAAQREPGPPAPAAPVIDVKNLSGAEIDALIEALRGEQRSAPPSKNGNGTA